MSVLGKIAKTVGGSLIGAVSSIGTSALNYKNQKKLNQQNYEYNKALSELAYSQNVDMWNKQNEYNSPSAQMERLSAAGLNPNLVYGNGEVVGNTTSDVPELSYNPYQGQNAYFADPMGSMVSAGTLALNQEVQKSHIDLMNAQALEALSKSKGQDIRNYIDERSKEQQISKYEFVNNQISSLTDLYRAKTNKTNNDLEWIDALNGAQLSLYNSQERLNDANSDVAKASYKNIMNEIKWRDELSPSQKALMYANVRFLAKRCLEISANIDRLNSEKNNIDADTYNKQLDSIQKEWQNLVNSQTMDDVVSTIQNNAESSKWQAKYSKKEARYYGVKAVVGMSCDVLNSAANAANGAANVVSSLYGAGYLKGGNFSDVRYTDPRGVTRSWRSYDAYTGNNGYNYLHH